MSRTSALRRGVLGWLAGRSLRNQLSWSATAVVAAWVLLLAVGANLLLSAALATEADGVLKARAEAAATTVGVGADGGLVVREPHDDAALDVGTWVLDRSGAIVERPSGTSRALDATAQRLAAGGGRTIEVGDELRVRLLAQPVPGPGGQPIATVVTSTSLAPYQRLARIALWGSSTVAVLLLVIVHLVLRLNVSRVLRPVRQMTEQAGRWSADDVGRRFGNQPRPAELAELAATLDGVLDRLSAVLRHEQRLTDELSHELRNPLARLRAEVDLARAWPSGDPAVAAGLATVDAAAADLQEVVGTLLAAGRGGARTAPGRSRPAEVVTGLGEALAAPVAVLVDVDPELVVGVDAAVLGRLLAPLLDNAVRYARRTVRVHARRGPESVVLVVDDDGPGVPAADVQRVFAPGWRADPADGHPGGGLGLALTRRLAGACGGDVRAVARAAGGRFEVTLPPG